MIRTIPILVFLLFAPAANAAEPLQRNPFRAPIEVDGPVAREETGPWPGAGPRTLDLRATIVAGRHSSVNLGGSILGLGEEIAGYRLVSVHEGEAVFEKGGESIRIVVGEDDEQTDWRNEL